MTGFLLPVVDCNVTQHRWSHAHISRRHYKPIITSTLAHMHTFCIKRLYLKSMYYTLACTWALHVFILYNVVLLLLLLSVSVPFQAGEAGGPGQYGRCSLWGSERQGKLDFRVPILPSFSRFLTYGIETSGMGLGMRLELTLDRLIVALAVIDIFCSLQWPYTYLMMVWWQSWCMRWMMSPLRGNPWWWLK